MAALGGGLVMGLMALALATILEGGSFGALVAPAPILLVTLGSFGAALMGFQMEDAKRLPKAAKVAMSGKVIEPDELISLFGRLAERARKEGTLAIESELESIDDVFVRSGLQLVVDGVDGEQLKEVMETEMRSVKERHHVMIKFFETMGGFSPTFGLMGTVIGLIGVLGNLDDPEHLGKGMALGLLGTLYGVVFANLVYLPIAAKLQRLHDMEIEVRELTLEGVLAIREGISARLLVERLEARLAPERRVGLSGRKQAAGGGPDGEGPSGEAAA